MEQWYYKQQNYCRWCSYQENKPSCEDCKQSKDIPCEILSFGIGANRDQVLILCVDKDTPQIVPYYQIKRKNIDEKKGQL